MRTLTQFFIILVGGLFVISGCAPNDVTPSSRIEPTTSATATPRQMTESEVEARQSQTIATGNFLFYNSHATW